MNNWDRVNKGFDALLKALVKYEVHELAEVYGPDRWWEEGVDPVLSPEQRRNVAAARTDEERICSLDAALALSVLDRCWGEVFRKRLSRDCRTWANELKGVRIKTAHRGVADMSDDDAYRALDTMQRLCAEVDIERAEPIRALMREVRYGSEKGSAGAVAVPVGKAASKRSVASLGAEDLSSWRSVMTPHPDVAAGRYRKAEFAADLNQVVRGTAANEYLDPVEFFSRTYMTAGIKGLLTQALRRVSGRDGEPVIQLKTAFGGGKTHSMLSLYHLLRGGFKLDDVPNAREVVREAGLEIVPPVNVAVVVGTALDPSKAKLPADMPGVKVNTIWGDIAYQLAKSAGKPELYRYVQEADRRHVSPGSEALTRLFDACGPCLVLLDEFVAYAKKLKDADNLAAGTFDNLITFVQELTEAAKASRSSIVVASIPESEREIGGDAGQEALEAIEHTFGRVESIWKPVTADEGFSVVSRRLFSSHVNERARDAVCRAFCDMYRDNPQDFPIETRDTSYFARMKSCYPVHPEVYDRLYDDWASIDGFQRTRGVLRFMAAVIHELWTEGDEGPLIMVGSIPLDVPAVRDELTRYLPDAWNSVVDNEVDGKNSEPYKADAANARFNKVFASRRVARTIFMGSAPDVAAQNARGIELARLKLGVVRPGDNISVFNDALMNLRNRASFLYSDSAGLRFWYDMRPTLRRMAEQRAEGMKVESARYELEQRLRRLRVPSGFAGIHVCPASSLDVPDEQGVRLVVLGLDATIAKNGGVGLDAAKEILATRGTTLRRFKNDLVFLAPDEGRQAGLVSEARLLLAWRSIERDAELLDLTKSQIKEVSSAIGFISDGLSLRLNEAYCWALVPGTDLASGSMDTTWDTVHLSGTGEDPLGRLVSRLRSDELIVDCLAPMLLKMQLDRYLWVGEDCVEVGTLWNQLCTYCYLPRLLNFEVLADTIRRGSSSNAMFGIAAGIEPGEDGGHRFVDLNLGKATAMVNMSDYLVKPEVARVQLEREAPQASEPNGAIPEPIPPLSEDVSPAAERLSTQPEPAGHGFSESPMQPIDPPRPHRFEMHADLDATRVIRQMQQIMEEVVSQLEGARGADVSFTLTVVAHTPEGFSVPVKRTVSENCRNLGIRDCDFSE